jgi:flagellar basal body-associated protein FliL
MKQNLSSGKSKQTVIEYIKRMKKKYIVVVAILLLVFVFVVGAAIATFCAVLVALFGMRNERIKAQEDRKDAQEKFLASQKQTQDALEEGRRQFLEAQYATNRPLLVPTSQPSPDASCSVIAIENVGSGVAINIWGYSYLLR